MKRTQTIVDILFHYEACSYNDIFVPGCKVYFKGVYENLPIKLLDLTRNDAAEINWSGVWGDKMKSFAITSIEFYHNRSRTPTKFLREGDGKIELKGGKWNASIKVNLLSRIIFKIYVLFSDIISLPTKKALANMKNRTLHCHNFILFFLF